MTVSSGIDAPPDGMSPGIGHTVEIVTKVTEALSAETLGNPGVNVLATPCLAGLCDEAAAKVCGDGKHTGCGWILGIWPRRRSETRSG